jgi:outer membrane protein OmpA-like peptidoglycan-associated protein
MNNKIIILFLAMMPVFVFGQQMKLEKISELLFNFDYNSYQLKIADYSKLDSFIKKIENKKGQIIVSSGTDSLGDMSYNEKLSENRSKTILNYLLKKGCSKDVLSVKNFGENNPLSNNSTEEGRRKNRFTKVEFFEETLDLENYIRISATLKDDETNTAIADSMLLVFKGEEPDTFFTDKDGNVEIIVHDSIKTIDLFIKDYFFVTVNTQELKSKDTKIQVPVKKAKVGNKASFDDINFYGGKAVMISGSYKICDKITRFLKYNPHLSVEIAGHVNVPNSPNVSTDTWDFQLSEQRSKRVMDYLLEKGISKERLISKGYGNWEMLFPNAIAEEDQKKNRRVEVRIVK